MRLTCFSAVLVLVVLACAVLPSRAAPHSTKRPLEDAAEDTDAKYPRPNSPTPDAYMQDSTPVPDHPPPAPGAPLRSVKDIRYSVEQYFDMAALKVEYRTGRARLGDVLATARARFPGYDWATEFASLDVHPE